MNGATNCICGRGEKANHDDCDWLYGQTTFGPTRAEIAEQEREERRRDIGDKWAEDYARDEAAGLLDDDGPPPPYFTDEENDEFCEWLASERE